MSVAIIYTFLVSLYIMPSVGSSGLETELELRQASELLYESYSTAALKRRASI
jgi:hypothetical protein